MRRLRGKQLSLMRGLDDKGFWRLIFAKYPKLESLRSEFTLDRNFTYYYLGGKVGVMFLPLSRWNSQMSDEFIGNKEFMSGYCSRINNDLGVFWNGDCTFCCGDFDAKMKLGNLRKTPLNELLSSGRAAAIREANSREKLIEPICFGCRRRS